MTIRAHTHARHTRTRALCPSIPQPSGARPREHPFTTAQNLQTELGRRSGGRQPLLHALGRERERKREREKEREREREREKEKERER